MRESWTITIRLLGYLRSFWPRVGVAYLAMGIDTLLTVVVPYILKWVVDVALTPAAARTPELVALPDLLPGDAAIEAAAIEAGPMILVWAALLIVAIAVVRSLFAFAHLYLGSWLSQQGAYALRNHLFRHLQHLSFAFHDRAQSGDLMSRAISDISKVQQFIGQGLLEGLNTPVLLAAVAVALFSLDATLAAIALSPMLILAVITLRFAQIIEPRFKAVQDQEGVISTRAQENFTGIRVVKAFAREDWESTRFAEANEEYLRRRIRVIAGFADYFPAMSATVVLALVLLLWFGGRMVLAGEVTLGTLVSFNLWVVILARPVQNLGFLVNRAGEAVAAGRRLFEVLDTPSDIVERPDALELPPLDGRVTFEGVDFSYGERQVLHDITFEAEPNQVIALFGPTGAGKTSVVNLIPRFYDVDGGAVRVDGHNVRDVTLESLRRQIAMVLQDTFLFSATIRDNIAYGCKDADEDAVVEAAKIAHAHAFISQMPEGYDTLIGERGVNLSGGQRQRVAIARALILQPRILILDDAMSAVDTETEFQIRQALAELMRGRTTFVIAQRLLTLKNADQVLVMDEGRIVERGTHDELLAADGLYARIYDIQLRDQERVARELEAMR